MPDTLGPLAATARQTAAALCQRPDLQALWQQARQARDEMARLVSEITRIPAPTGDEGRRGEHVSRLFEQWTATPAEADEVGNRWIRLVGARGPGPRLMVSAHLDTVFPAGTACSVREEGGKLLGPGIGDNGAGLAVLLTCARLLHESGRPFAGELLVAANVGEEGLGNLRGMRALCDRFAGDLDGALALDGSLGHVVGEAVGSRRYRVSVSGPGGHSWSDFGTPSAIHHLVKLAARLADLRVPEQPRTTFNIGIVEGGTSVNSIAERASLLLDLRSVDVTALAQLDERARAAIQAEACPKELAVTVESLGERPAGDARGTQDWVDIARAVWERLRQPFRVTSSSTDANIPLALGLRASTMGICRGGRAHTLSEWLDPDTLPLGLEALLLTLLTAFEMLGAARSP